MRFEKNDLEASRECCLGDIFVGEEGATAVPFNTGEAGVFSDLICVSSVVDDCGMNAGDKGGDRGERGDSVICGFPPPFTEDGMMSLLELLRFKGETLLALLVGIAMHDV